MKVQGQIILSKDSGRKELWVTKKVENDYFLALKILQIGEQPIKTTKDAFLALRDFFPQVMVQSQVLNDLFEAMRLPPNVEDISNIALGNFPDFRLDRNIANDVDHNKVAIAESLHGEVIDFEITPDDFELVATCNTEDVKLSEGSISKANTVGFNRDAIMNIRLSPQMQEKLNAYSKKVFGDNYVLWNSQKQPVPYHFTIAQTNRLGDAIAKMAENREDKLGIELK
ncbi:MAG: hypothetical protein H0U71_04935 [Gammaproteobacteria bacterium]|nr:hypothetical protein [Gammaproteobacteria bacterium]